MYTLTRYSSVQANNGVIQRWWERDESNYQTEHDHAEAVIIKKYATLAFGGQGYSPSVNEGDSFIGRTLHSWDTSSIGANMGIVSATITFRQYGDYGDWCDLSGFSLVVQNGQPTYPNLPPVVGDYLHSHYSGNGGSIAAEDWTVFVNNTEYTITLNAEGRSWINKTGVTKLLIRSDTDIDSTDFVFAEQWRYWHNLTVKLTVVYGPIYPSDAMTRVSSIRRVYRPGLYRMEVALGELGFEVDVNEISIKRVPDEIVEPEVPPEEPSVVPKGEPVTPKDIEEIIRWQQKTFPEWYTPPPSWATRTTAPFKMPPPIKAGGTTPVAESLTERLARKWKELTGRDFPMK